MKKMLRKELLLLLYSLATREVNGSGEDMSKEIEYVFNMLAILTDEETMSEITTMWETKNDGLTDKVWAPDGNDLHAALMYRLTKFDRDVRFLLIDKKYI